MSHPTTILLGPSKIQNVINKNVLSRNLHIISFGLFSLLSFFSTESVAGDDGVGGVKEKLFSFATYC